MFGLSVCSFTSPASYGLVAASAASPAFVMLLLLKISGVPPLERLARKRWGGQPDYEAYRRRTREVVLWPVCGQAAGAEAAAGYGSFQTGGK